MYSSDRPITNYNDDLLGRADFAKQLGKAVFEYPCSDGLVIGLYGKWGSGKTSVVNMAIQEIESQSKGSDSAPYIFKFAPWNYSDKDNLISQFFNCLKNRVFTFSSGMDFLHGE